MWYKLLIIFLLSIFAVSAQLEDERTALSFDNQIDLLRETVLDQELPGFTKRLFGNERMNIHVALEDKEEVVIGMVTAKGAVANVENGELPNPTLNVYVAQETIQKIMTSDNSLNTFQEALQNKEITYKAVGLRKKIKFGFLSLVAKWFG